MIQNKFNNEFNKIKKKGWISSKRNGSTGIGYTFETMLNKKEDNFPIADYGDIEIKTIHNYLKEKVIHLFNATPDGDYLFPIKEIIQNLGYPDKNNPEYRVFNMDVTAMKYTNIGYNKKMILKVDYNNKKIYLKIISKDKNIENMKISWSFDLLRERIEHKIKKLAIVGANTKKNQNIEKFKYTGYRIYEIKSFDHFIKNIENGNIVITFKIGNFKTGKRKGQIHDHGTGFSIKYNNIEELYTRTIK